MAERFPSHLPLRPHHRLGNSMMDPTFQPAAARGFTSTQVVMRYRGWAIRQLLPFLGRLECIYCRPNYHRAGFEERTNYNSIDFNGAQTRTQMYIEMPKEVVEEDEDVKKASPACGHL